MGLYQLLFDPEMEWRFAFTMNDLQGPAIVLLGLAILFLAPGRSKFVGGGAITVGLLLIALNAWSFWTGWQSDRAAIAAGRYEVSEGVVQSFRSGDGGETSDVLVLGQQRIELFGAIQQRVWRDKINLNGRCVRLFKYRPHDNERDRIIWLAIRTQGCEPVFNARP